MQILRLLFLRLASAIPVVLVVVTVVFLLVRLTGDPATILAGDMASPEVVASVRADLGLDRPLLGQYAQWLWDLLQGNLGTSIVTKQPVATLIGERLESTWCCRSARWWSRCCWRCRWACWRPGATTRWWTGS